MRKTIYQLLQQNSVAFELQGVVSIMFYKSSIDLKSNELGGYGKTITPASWRKCTDRPELQGRVEGVISYQR